MRRFYALGMLISGCADDGDQPGAPPTVDPAACEVRDVLAPQTDFFTDVSAQSGIQVGNFDPNPPEGMVINDHSRLAFADLNSDGFDDMVMHSLYPNPRAGVPFEHLVFLNNQDGTFSDHSDASGLRDVQAGFFAFADVDNDGDQDAFAGLDLPDLGDHRSAILLNDGSGVFTPVENSGVNVLNPTAATAVFADFDGDAVVDLFVGNGHTSYTMADQLFWGRGDGRFDLDTGALASPPAQPTNGAVACDVDSDGDLDIFVGSYGVSVAKGHNQLWRNDGGEFTDVAGEAGVAALPTGNPLSRPSDYGASDQAGDGPEAWVGTNTFGVDCGDVDNDGDLDLVFAAISHPSGSDASRYWSDPTTVLLNDGTGTFSPVQNSGLPFNEGDIDAGLVDFDNDGLLDLSLTRDPKYEQSYDEAEQFGWFGLMRGVGGGDVRSVGLLSGINVDLETGTDSGKKKQMKGGQNHAWSDIDHDGDLDLLVGGRDQGGGRPNFLYENTIGDQNRWVAIALRGDGDAVSRDAFGARVAYAWSDEVILREKRGSRGTYNSEDSRWIHIGLGSRTCDAEITVTWPDGQVASFDWADIGESRFVTIAYPDVIEK